MSQGGWFWAWHIVRVECTVLSGRPESNTPMERRVVIILTGGSKGSHGYPLVTGSPYAPHAGDSRLVIWCTVVMWGSPKPCGLGRVGVGSYGT